MPRTPSMPITANQHSMTGPKMRPMKPGAAAAAPGTARAGSTSVIGRTAGASDRRVDLEPLDGGEHRDGRRDGAVAIEQRRADEPDDQEAGPPGAGRGVAGAQQRQHGDDAALAAVVGPQDQDRVFDARRRRSATRRSPRRRRSRPTGPVPPSPAGARRPRSRRRAGSCRYRRRRCRARPAPARRSGGGAQPARPRCRAPSMRVSPPAAFGD